MTPINAQAIDKKLIQIQFASIHTGNASAWISMVAVEINKLFPRVRVYSPN